MIYYHRITKQKVQMKTDCGDIIEAYVLDGNLNKIKLNSSYKTIICNKKNLVEVIT